MRLWDVESGRIERKFNGHSDNIWGVAWSPDQRQVLSGSVDRTMRLWDAKTGRCSVVFEGHTNYVIGVAWSRDQQRVLSGSYDKTVRMWDANTGKCLQAFEGHAGSVRTVAWSADASQILSGGEDSTLRLWDAKSGWCARVLEGHTDWVWSVAWRSDWRYVLSTALDGIARLWDLETGRCLRVLPAIGKRVWNGRWTVGENRAVTGDETGNIRLWDLSEFVSDYGTTEVRTTVSKSLPDQVEYTNAKVLLVGDSHAGKTGLSNRLAKDIYAKTDSTVGAWATQWKLPLEDTEARPSRSSSAGDADGDSLGRDDRATNVEREVWLWDFGGQADQRLIHQLYMDQTQVAALVFDPQKDDCVETLAQWDRDLSRADKDKPDRDKMTKLLVAGRCDAGGLRVARRQIDDFVAERGYAAYLETSAKTRAGCAELKQAIIDGIQWENIPWRSSPLLFKRLKDEIIKLKDEGRVLMRFNELREVLALRMSEPTAR